MSAKWAGTHRVGFTLIELLVVVSIIALLIAILLPSLKKARTQARITKCATQLHDIGIALMSYANDYNRFPPQNSLGAPPPDWRSIETVADRQGAAFWTYAVHRELATHMGGLRTNKAGERSKVHQVFYCPEVPDTKLFNTTDNLNMADILSGSYPDGTYTGYGVRGSEDVYLHISYAYYGSFHEVFNDPAKPRSTDEEINGVPRWRRFYVKNEPNASRILMSDWVMLWGGATQWRINHGVPWGSTRGASRAQFSPPIMMTGANEMFGDAHVEWKSKGHFFRLLEVPAGAMGWLEAITNAAIQRNPDYMWW